MSFHHNKGHPQETDEGDTISKQHSLKAVELSQRIQTAVQIVSKSPAPRNGGPIYHFLASRPCKPVVWLALLLIKAGDVETNPRPATSSRQIHVRQPHTKSFCDICHKQIHVTKHISIWCNMIEHCVHLGCTDIRQAQYTYTWTFHIHRKLRLISHRHTTPPLQILVQATPSIILIA